MVGDSMPLSATCLLSIVPIAESRSSYNGLLIFLFMLLASVAAVCHPPLASKALGAGRLGIAAIPTETATQYSASSFAQPIRRVFGTLVFRARETVEMPPPAMRSRRGSSCNSATPSGTALYAPIGGAVDIVADRLNRLQYLSIRHYLSFVFVALVGLLAGVGDLAMIHALAIQAAQMLLVLALAPLLIGFVRKIKARLVRRQGPPLIQPYRDLVRLHA